MIKKPFQSSSRGQERPMIYFGHWPIVLNTPPPFCCTTDLMFRSFNANFYMIYCIKIVKYMVHKHSEIVNKVIFLRSHQYCMSFVHIYEKKYIYIVKCVIKQKKNVKAPLVQMPCFLCNNLHKQAAVSQIQPNLVFILLHVCSCLHAI